MPTTEERLAAIEATLVHMATKEELQALRAELRAGMQELRVELIKWMVGTGIGIASVAATLAGILVRFGFTE
ncbi:MAG: hypothetical protein OXF96_00715 [Chloroflexi bacterium]|nr:hypothetical protein [Chloroflexota bacterium]